MYLLILYIYYVKYEKIFKNLIEFVNTSFFCYGFLRPSPSHTQISPFFSKLLQPHGFCGSQPPTISLSPYPFPCKAHVQPHSGPSAPSSSMVSGPLRPPHLLTTPTSSHTPPKFYHFLRLSPLSAALTTFCGFPATPYSTFSVSTLLQKFATTYPSSSLTRCNETTFSYQGSGEASIAL